MNFTSLIIAHCLRLKVLVQIRPELLLQPIRVESKQALQSVSEAQLRVLQRHASKLVVHGLVEVFPQEKRPEAEQRVHLLRLTLAQSFAILHASTVILVIRLLRKIVVLEQRMRRMLEHG